MTCLWVGIVDGQFRVMHQRPARPRAAVIPTARDTDSRSSPRNRRSTTSRFRPTDNRPPRPGPAASPVALRAPSAAADPCIWFPHLDTPPASTLSQSSVQENPRAQDRHETAKLRAPDECGPPERHPGRRRSDRGDDTAPGTRSPDASHTRWSGRSATRGRPVHAIRPTGGDRMGATHRVDLRRAKGTPASRWSTVA